MLTDDSIQNAILMRKSARLDKPFYATPLYDSRIDIRTPSATSKLLLNRNNFTSISKNTAASSRKSIKIVKPETIKRARDDAFMAASIGDLEWLKQTLSITDELVFDKNGYATIHLAAIHARLNIIKYLVEEKRVNINLPSLIQRWRPIHLCITAQNGPKAVDCLIYMIERGADINLTNADGQGCLHIAATEGQLECIKILLELNADTTIKDVRGQTALDLARLWGHRMCAKYLSDDLWHVTKKVLAEQIELERKLQAQQILKEVESAHYSQYPNEEDSARNFDEWLKNQGFISEETDKENLLSHRSQIYNQTLRSIEQNRKEESFNKSPQSARKKPNSKKATNKVSSFKNKNEKPWNHSTKAVESEYISRLEDYYPRDPYTFLPKDLDYVLVNKELKGMSLEQVKEFMKKNLGRVGSASSLNHDSNRPVYFKPKHVLDSQTKSKADNDKLNDEAWLNMCNDVKSFQFQEAKKYVVESIKPKKQEALYGGYYHTSEALKTIKKQLNSKPVKDEKLEVVEKLYGKDLSNFMKDPRHGKMSQKYEKVFIC